jgi:SAM-dependent methyltransferase
VEKTVRTHDLFYLNENRYDEPKQLHQEILTSIETFLNNAHNAGGAVVLDAGCAAGEFAYYLHKKLTDVRVFGFDLLPDLIEKAKVKVSGVEFSVGDIQSRSTIDEGFADVVTCTGVLSIFDDFVPVIENLIHWCKPEGRVYLHSLFSNYPFDVRLRYGASDSYGSGVLETGWNIFSKATVSNFLESKIDSGQITSFRFYDFNLKTKLEMKDDLIRSWTFRDEQGNLMLTNGLNILQPHAILEIVK